MTRIYYWHVIAGLVRNICCSFRKVFSRSTRNDRSVAGLMMSVLKRNKLCKTAALNKTLLILPSISINTQRECTI